jgi:hypothetical protein
MVRATPSGRTLPGPARAQSAVMLRNAGNDLHASLTDGMSDSR